MKRGGGFTLIELMITLTVMIILMTIAIVSVRASERDTRDQERKTDIDTIARGLETYYAAGSAYASTPKGYYPGGQEVATAVAATPPYQNFLEGVGAQAFKAPRAPTATSFNVDPNYVASPVAGANADGSYSDAQATTFLSTRPYLYQPLTRSDAFCASYANCVRFNLYYLAEKTNTVQIVRSRNQ